MACKAMNNNAAAHDDYLARQCPDLLLFLSSRFPLIDRVAACPACHNHGGGSLDCPWMALNRARHNYTHVLPPSPSVAQGVEADGVAEHVNEHSNTSDNGGEPLAQFLHLVASRTLDDDGEPLTDSAPSESTSETVHKEDCDPPAATAAAAAAASVEKWDLLFCRVEMMVGLTSAQQQQQPRRSGHDSNNNDDDDAKKSTSKQEEEEEEEEEDADDDWSLLSAIPTAADVVRACGAVPSPCYMGSKRMFICEDGGGFNVREVKRVL